jgi:hypothetical protein
MHRPHYLFVLLVAATACFPGMRRDGRGVADGFDRRPVASKEAPASLFSADGSRCLVNESRFRDTVIGQGVWCWWTGPGGDGDGARRTTPSGAAAADGAARTWEKARTIAKKPGKPSA